MPRYLLDLPEDASPRRFDPRDPPAQRKDMVYWSGVLRAMESHLAREEIDVIVTYNHRALPAYGPHVVAIVLGDEVGSVPRYVARVGSVFKCYGSRPALGAGPLRNRSLTGLAELAQATTRWVRWLPSWAAYRRTLAGCAHGATPSPPPVVPIPLGTFNLVDLPLAPFAARPIDVSFAGSVEHGSRRAHGWLSPKRLARRDMLAAVAGLRASHPGLRIEMRVTRDFQTSEHSPSDEYSRMLMDSRICLAPRGTSVETFRLLEGLRSGCLVVSDRLPKHWFYKGAPIVQIDRWRALEPTLRPLLASPEALEAMQARSRAWWESACSEDAVGRVLADHINSSTRGPSSAA